MFDAGTRTGLVVEGVLIPFMLTRYGWRTTFVFVGFAALAWLLPWFRSRRVSCAAPANPWPRPPACGTRLPLLTNRNLIGVCIGFFCFDYYWYFLVNWLPDYLVTSRGLTIVKAGIFAALPYFVFGASEPIGGWIADRMIRIG